MNNEEEGILTEEQVHASLPWDEITADEKVERLREVIKTNQQQINRLQQGIYDLRNAFCQHSHREDHRVVVPCERAFQQYGVDKCRIAVGSNKPWF